MSARGRTIRRKKAGNLSQLRCRVGLHAFVDFACILTASLARARTCVLSSGSMPESEQLFEIARRTFDTPEFRSITFLEAEAKTIINHVPGNAMPLSCAVHP